MSSETSGETRRVYEEIVLSNYERLVYSPAGCTPRLSSILLVFLAPIFFLGLGGNIFCAYWYLVVKREFGRNFVKLCHRPILRVRDRGTRRLPGRLAKRMSSG